MANGFEPLSDEQCKEAADIWLETRNYAEISRRLGITRSAAQNRVKKAAKRGFLPTDPVMPGFQINSISTQLDGNDEIKSTSIRQVQERTPYSAPQNHGVTGVSSLLDADGNVVQQWVKTKAEPDPTEVSDSVKRAFENWIPKHPALSKPKNADRDLMTVYPALDWHMDLRCSASETGDEEWNIERAVTVYKDIYSDLISQVPSSENALFLGLGDLCHRDGLEALTTHNKHPLDVSGSYGDMILSTSDLLADILEMVAAKHRKVSVVLKPGNHDETATVALRLGLHYLYRGNERITVDMSDEYFYCTQFGINMIGGCHGEKISLDDMPMKFANNYPEIFAASKTRTIHSGHRHRDQMQERDGFRSWIHRAPIPKQAYDAPLKYVSGRSVKAFNHHREIGSRGHVEVEIH